MRHGHSWILFSFVFVSEHCLKPQKLRWRREVDDFVLFGGTETRECLALTFCFSSLLLILLFDLIFVLRFLLSSVVWCCFCF